MPRTPPYRPRPIDTTGVTLGHELSRLIERLAENNHDLWAQARMSEGWSYGPRRNDDAKHHPGLIPYGELEESEKEYDRLMAVEALKAIVALGFRIEPPEGAAAGASDDMDPTSGLRELRGWLGSGQGLGVGELLAIWRAHDERLWRLEPDLYTLLARHLLRFGEPLLAHEVLAEARSGRSARDPEREHLYGLALARSGAPETANRIAATLRSELAPDSELTEDVLGLLGRTHKDLAFAAPADPDRERHLRRALEAYGDAFDRTGGSYTGINAATVALLLDRTAEAESLARRAREAARTELAAGRSRGRDVYWQLATLGEAALVLGDEEEAERWYTEAAEVVGSRFGDLASTRRQARLVASRRGADPGWIDAVLHVPRVVVFAGYMMDVSNAGVPRLPAGSEAALAAALDQRLAELDAGFAFSSAACGSDLLFLEAMSRRGAQATIVLPYPPERFVETHVGCACGGGWIERFWSALDRALEVHTAAGAPFPADGVLFDYSSQLMLGLAAIHSRAIDAELVPLVVWDGQESGTSTAAVVRSWRDCGYTVSVLPPPRLPDAV